MIKRAKDLKRSERNKLQSFVRGIYLDEEGDLFGSYLLKYNNSVVTLLTALSYHNLIDNWINQPYDFAFPIGYRQIHDANIRQFKEKKEILLLGVVSKDYEGTYEIGDADDDGNKPVTFTVTEGNHTIFAD